MKCQMCDRDATFHAPIEDFYWYCSEECQLQHELELEFIHRKLTGELP